MDDGLREGAEVSARARSVAMLLGVLALSLLGLQGSAVFAQGRGVCRDACPKCPCSGGIVCKRGQCVKPDPCDVGTAGWIKHRAEIVCDCDGDGTAEVIARVEACGPAREGEKDPRFQTNPTVDCVKWANKDRPSVDTMLSREIQRVMSDHAKPGKKCALVRCNVDRAKCEDSAKKALDKCELRHGNVPGRGRTAGDCMKDFIAATEKCNAKRDGCLQASTAAPAVSVACLAVQDDER